MRKVTSVFFFKRTGHRAGKGYNMNSCYTPKFLYVVEWHELYINCLGKLCAAPRIDERVFALTELDACCKVADKNPDGYGFVARRVS